MALTPAQGLALDELSECLYEFLPGSPHPYASKAISFPGVADEIGLSNCWPGGSKRPAIRHLLEQALTNGSGKFSSLIERIVLRGITYRKSKNPVSREEINSINTILVRLGFQIKALHDRSFLDALPSSEKKAEPEDAQKIDTAELLRDFQTLTAMKAHERGFAFEKFLPRLFASYQLKPRSSFRLVGEQIDGSFQLKNEVDLHP